MTFIYAKKFSDTIAIFSDTKITFNENVFIKPEQKLVHSYGIVKAYIVNKHCAIAFAGKCIDINSLLLNLVNETDINIIKSLCWEKHKNSLNEEKKYNTDFALAIYQNDNFFLYEIKGGEINQVESCWLGSSSAFNEFQSRKLGKNKLLNDANINFVNSDAFCSDYNMKSYNEYFDIFYNSVYACNDRGVGNFVVPLIFNSLTKRFEFRSYIKNEPAIKYKPTDFRKTADKIIINYSSSNLIGTNRANGDYSVCFFGSCNNNIIIYIVEIFLAICFSCGRSDLSKTDKEFSNLSIPHIKKLSIYQLQYEIQDYGFKQPPMLPYSYEILKIEILRFFGIAKKLIEIDFNEAEKLMIFTTNNLFRQYIPLIEKNHNEINDFQEYLEFINSTKWTCKLKINLEEQ